MRYLAAAVAIWLAGVCSAQATLVSYTNEAAFSIAVSDGFKVEDFENFAIDADFSAAPLVLSDFTISYHGILPSGGYNFVSTAGVQRGGLAGNVIVGGLLGGETITFSFHSPVLAFGADFFALNDVVRRSQFIVDGTTFRPPVFGSVRSQFLGITSATPFTELVIKGLPSTEGFGVDNIRYKGPIFQGVDAVAAPVPPSLALLAGALVGLTLLKRLQTSG